MLEAIDSTIYQIESKDATTIRASVLMFLISKYIHNTDVKVIFSGEGSDEHPGHIYIFIKHLHLKRISRRMYKTFKDVCMFDVLRSDKTTAGTMIRNKSLF